MLHRQGAIAVAKKALGRDGALPRIQDAEARRQIPYLLLRVPADRRLKKVAVAIDEIRLAVRPGAEHELNLGIQLDECVSQGITAGSFIEEMIAAAFDGKLDAKPLERIAGRLGEALMRRHACRESERAPHGMVTIARRLLAVAFRAGLVADIFHFGADVTVRSGEGHPGILIGRRWRCRRPPLSTPCCVNCAEQDANYYLVRGA